MAWFGYDWITKMTIIMLISLFHGTNTYWMLCCPEVRHSFDTQSRDISVDFIVIILDCSIVSSFVIVPAMAKPLGGGGGIEMLGVHASVRPCVCHKAC